MLNISPRYFIFLFLLLLSSWRRKWQPIPVFLPGESQGQRSLVGCFSWGHKESDKTEWLSIDIIKLQNEARGWIPRDRRLGKEWGEGLGGQFMLKRVSGLSVHYDCTPQNMVSGPIVSWWIDGETMETVTDFIFFDSKITAWWLQPWN